MVNNLIRDVKDNWIILAFIVSLVISWTQFQGRVTSLENRVTTIETSLVEINKTHQEITVTLAKMQTTLEFIKANITK